MNYWLLTTEFPPQHGGGISTYCLQTANMMAEKGDKLSIFLYDHSVDSIEISELFFNCRLIHFNFQKSSISNILGFEARLSFEYAQVVLDFIKKESKPDFIETQDYLGIGYYLQQESWMNNKLLEGTPIIVTMHAASFLYLEYNQAPLYQLPNYWTGEMEKASIGMADLLISPSQYLINELKGRLDFPIDAKKLFNPYEINTGISKTFKQAEISFFGKLTLQKGSLKLFQYLKEMWDEGFDKSIRIIGGGDHFFYPEQEDIMVFLQKKYHKYITKGLIVFEGKVSPGNLEKYLSTAHIIVVPSIVDNLPYAVIEAMSMGKVVLASDCGGHKELINPGVNGFIFSHEKNNFQEKLEEILVLPVEKILEVGENAQKSIRKNLEPSFIYQEKLSLLKNIEKRSNKFPFTRKSLNPDLFFKVKNQKLSVVVPCYNLMSTIEKCLESLSNMDYKNFEIIVINDGSTEKGAKQFLENLQKKFSFKLVHQKNLGLSETRNHGASIANGDFLAFLDADDCVQPNYYTKAIKLLNAYDNLHFVGCWAQYFGESNEVWPAFNPEPPYILYHNMINSSALIFKKDSFLKYGLNKRKMIYGMEDYESVINMLKNGARGVAIPETLWYYRIRKNSMQQSFNNHKQQYLYSLIADEHEDFFNMYGAELSKLFNNNGPGFLVENPTWGTAQNRIFEKFIPEAILKIIKQNALLRKVGKAVYRKLNKN